MTAPVRPVFDSAIALTRVDERIARSSVGEGLLERQNFANACASLWLDGELVHLEDFVLHDASHDIRTPTRTDHRSRRPAHPLTDRRAGAPQGAHPERSPQPM